MDIFTKFHVKIHIYLVQNVPHVGRLSIRKHDKFDICCRLVVVQFILSRTVAYETTRIPIVSGPS